MPKFGPIKRRDFIAYLNNAGFEGPYSGGKHQFMIRDSVTLRVPNPHRGDISKDLLSRILRQAGISREEWEGL
ncbi:type II toxin-antitoxin system HicA family toxin [Candidatus Thiosymbion oneisti]|uniref:type II toxin-antitoxin system HicA family toxin n=1 Tax=Candidatus Thiosymbion oneisti TaxID=589554 RepID=UPI0010608ACA|nr:type II toxin-antitoxin system HicA family toxin [Candidatus Thiosymbion oneisti]